MCGNLEVGSHDNTVYTHLLTLLVSIAFTAGSWLELFGVYQVTGELES